jgi:hypothetical protein
VFFPWKGIQSVREHVVPSNPNSTAQQTQRGYMSAAVAEWHTGNYTTEDVGAFNRFAGILAKTMSGFNAFCQKHIAENMLGNTWKFIRNVLISDIVVDGCTVTCTAPLAGATILLKYGTRKTYLGSEETMNDLTGGQYDFDLTGLAPSTKYYFQIIHGATGVNYGMSGIFEFTTAAS